MGREITYTDAVREALREAMRRDPAVIVMGEDVAGGAGREEQGLGDAWGGPMGLTKGLIGEFGKERVRDTPISESAFIGAAVGAAATGLRPVVDLMFSDFLGVTLDQIMNQAAKLRYMFGGKARVPLTVMTMVGAGIGAAAQHSQSPYAIFAHLPGLKVALPSDPYTAKGLMTAAIEDENPVIVCNHKAILGLAGDVPEGYYTLPVGRARRLRPGKDLTLVGLSRMSQVCMEAADRLSRDGIDAEVIDLLWASPIDEEALLDSVRRTHRLVVVDEANPVAGMASEIAARVAEHAFDDLDAPVRRVTAPHTPVPFSPALEQLYVPDAERVARVAREVVEGQLVG